MITKAKSMQSLKQNALFHSIECLFSIHGEKAFGVRLTRSVQNIQRKSTNTEKKERPSFANHVWFLDVT